MEIDKIEVVTQIWM